MSDSSRVRLELTRTVRARQAATVTMEVFARQTHAIFCRTDARLLTFPVPVVLRVVPPTPVRLRHVRTEICAETFSVAKTKAFS